MINNLDFVRELFLMMNQENLGYIYRGRFNQEITDNILRLTETNLQKQEGRSKVKKRIYSIMVEGLQNITRHQDNIQGIEKIEESFGIFIIQKVNDLYFITTGNIVDNEAIPKIKSLITKINKLNKDELKAYYKQVLAEGSLSNKGGAGLGLIDMARKSGNKLFYNFRKVDQLHSYFYLHTVPTITGDTLPEHDKNIKTTLQKISLIHRILIDENVLLVFNGEFNQESSLNLLSGIKGHITTSVSLKNKLFYVTVEMLQNVVKHGSELDDNTENPGIFTICETSKEYILNTGNLIQNSYAEKLEKKLNKINNYTASELEENYSKILFDFKVDDKKKSGLGFIDMRLKSGGSLLKFSLLKYTEHLTFFVLNISIPKN